MPDRASAVDRVLAQRLTTQGLTGRPFTTPAEAVRHLLAVQAQDAPLARWSLSLRSGGPDDASVRAAVDDGTLVRTHLLRPTWHYVAVEDLRWLLDLTAPKVLRTMGSRMRVLGLEDPAVVRREVDALLRLLAGHPLTRRQIVGAVGREDLKGERLGFVIGVAELEGLVCSGPLDRGQHTYALVEERVPPAKPKDREEALRELVLRFFSGHGPASVAHLVRWSTLTKREVVAALDDLGDRLERTDVNGEPHWCVAEPADAAAAGGAFLLPVFDEVYLTYPSSNFPRVPDHPWGERNQSFAESGGGVVVHDRRDVGWWKRTEAGPVTRLTLGIADSIDAAARDKVEAQGHALAAYTGRTLELVRQP